MPNTGSILVLVALVVATSESDARTWVVTPSGAGDAPTIQAAIDSAVSGDEVLLEAGTYTWTSQATTGFNMIRMKAGVGLRGQSGAANTTLDAETLGRVVLCDNTGSPTTIEGVTVRNGRSRGDILDRGGAGVLAIGNSVPFILDCVIQDNHAIDSNSGGGVACGRATVRNTAFLDNSTPRNFGGAMSCSSATIEYCVFNGNGAGDGGGGGAIATLSGTSISNCHFENNGVGSGAGAGGGAVFAQHEVVVEDCVFINNTTLGSSGFGSAVAFRFGTTGVVRNSIFISNSALGFGVNKGAIYSVEGSLVENCTLLGNSGGHSGGIGGIWMNGGGIVQNTIIAFTTEGQICGGSPGPTWICNDLYSNPLGNSICGTDGGGNISENSAFCATDPIASLNVTLQSDSPCAQGNHPDGEPCGLIGAGSVNCGTVAVEQKTWGQVKRLYREDEVHEEE